jgi:hypothetical protein
MSKTSLFDREECERILERLARLRPDSPRQWGKMDSAQTLAHCQQTLRVALGDLKLRRGLIGFLFGKMAKRQLMRPEPFKRGLPTAPEFRVADPREFTRERDKLVEFIRRFRDGGPKALIQEPHPFFGPLTDDEWDTLQWKHLDHHLRQFGA